MLKGKSVIGKSVLSRADGERVAELKDLIIAKDHSRIVALLTDEGGLFSKARAVPIARVVSFGKDAVVITDKGAVEQADTDPTIKESLDSKDRLVGKRVFSESGDAQAVVSDIYFDDTPGSNGMSGAIVGLELEGGVLQNSSDGTAYLPFSDIISIGQDAVVIKADAVNALLQQASGATQNPARVQGQ